MGNGTSDMVNLLQSEFSGKFRQMDITVTPDRTLHVKNVSIKRLIIS